MRRVMYSVAMVLIWLGGCVVVEPSAQRHGYLTDSDGALLRDRQGRCWRTADWRPELALPECDPALAPAQVVEALHEALDPPKPEPLLPASHTVYFGSAQYEMSGYAHNELKRFWATLAREDVGSLQVTVTGYADPMGDPDANLVLSHQRAENVKHWLREEGVAATSVTLSALGDTQAKNQCSGTLPRRERIACWASDRKVTVLVTLTGLGDSSGE